MNYYINVKFVGLCCLSFLVHLLFFSITHQPQAPSVVVQNTVVSMVSVAVDSFKPVIVSKSQSSLNDKSDRKNKVVEISEPISKKSLQRKPAETGEEKRLVDVDQNKSNPPISINKALVLETMDIKINAEPHVQIQTKVEPKVDSSRFGVGNIHKEVVSLAVSAPDFRSVDGLFNQVVSEPEPTEGVVREPRNTLTAQDAASNASNADQQDQKAHPLYKFNPKPKYPKVARSRGWQGSVLLEVVVSADGRVDKIAILKSSGYKVLDKEARRTVYRWRFRPAHVAGTAISSTVKIPIDFHLTAVRG